MTAPGGLGFAEAGLVVSKSFRFKPKTIDGRAVSGGTVRVPLHFKLPPNDAVEADATTRSDEVFGPPSPKALALAHRIVAAQALSQRAGLQFEVGLLPLADAKWAGVADKTRDDGLEAMRAGFAAYSADMETSIARAYASNFTEAELTDIAAFVDTPSGHAFMARLQKVSEDVHPPGNPAEVITAAAHKAFCATHPCALAPPPSDLPDPHAETAPKP